METDGVVVTFQYRTFQIIVQQNPGDAAPGGKRGDVAAQKVLHAGIEEEAQEDLPRVAQHHDERHQRTACPTDHQMAEMPPLCRESDYAECREDRGIEQTTEAV